MLIKFSVVRQDKLFVFWATPGGKIEVGETDLDAARRELTEELHLDVPLAGPVHRFVSTFEHKGVVVENLDIFFLGLCSQETFQLGGVETEERAAMQEVKWWSPDEIEVSTGEVFPPDLASLVRALASRVEAPET